MPDSSEKFDPYWEWLEIPPEDQPPTYYRLLGLEDFEDDLATIESAAKQTTAYLHPMAAGPNRESVQKLLSQVAKARRTLLGSEAKAAYDESLQVVDSSPEPPPLVQQNIASQNNAATPDSDSQYQQAAQQPDQPQPFRPLRKKSLLNDWRVHVTSALVLFLSAIGFVYYSNSKAKRVASVAAPIPESRQAKSNKPQRSAPALKTGAAGKSRNDSSGVSARDDVLPRTPKKPKKRASGQSALELMLAQDGLSMESVQGPANAMPPGGSQAKAEADKKRNGKEELPEYESIELPETWLAGLQVTKNFAMPLKQRFIDASLYSGLVAAEGKLVVQPTNPAGKVAKLTLKGEHLGLGDAVAVETNMDGTTPDGVQVGLSVGGLRLTLHAVFPSVELRINNLIAGELASAEGKGIVLAVIRDVKDGKWFHWIVKSGDKAVCGSGAFTPGLGKNAAVGVLARCGENEPKVAVAINEIAFGKLDRQLAISKTRRLEVSTKRK